ncbi:transcriptional regulator KorA [Pseudomonas aeruginosa]|nr:transcriptional regulator KorA [Pseudomonas aeruginosa]
MALTNEEFESALKHLPRRLAAKNVEIARAILVQGGGRLI